MCDEPTPQPVTPPQEQLETLRRRMVRELEEFLNQAIHRPFPRLQIKSPPVKRYTMSLN